MTSRLGNVLERGTEDSMPDVGEVFWDTKGLPMTVIVKGDCFIV